MESIVGNILASLVGASPQILIGAIGLVLIRSRLKRTFPKANLYGTVGLSLLLLSGLWSAVTRVYIQSNVSRHPVELANVITAANLVGFLILSASLVFLLVAVLADRELAPAK